MDTGNSQGNRGSKGTIFYSTLPLSPAHELSDIYFNFAYQMTITYFWLHYLHLPDCYLMRFTTLSNYHLIICWYDVNFYLLTWRFDSRFSLQQFETENWWTQTRSAKQLTKCASHPKFLKNDAAAKTASNESCIG